MHEDPRYHVYQRTLTDVYDNTKLDSGVYKFMRISIWVSLKAFIC